MKNKKAWILIIGLVLVCSGFGHDKPVWKGKIEYEDGVKVIKNPKEPLFGEITLELEEDLVIGNEEDENYMFWRVTQILVDNEMNIYVLDHRNCHVKKFNKDGKYIRTIGRKGQGPGEFQQPLYSYVNSKGTLYVRDFNKISVFNKDGKFLRTISLPLRMNPHKFAITEDENILGILSIFDPESSTKYSKSNFIIIHPEKEKEQIITTYASRTSTVKKNGMISKIFSPYDPEFYFFPFTENMVVYGNSSEYKLYVINTSGEMMFRIRKEEPAEAISRDEKNEIVDNYIETNPEIEQKFSRSKIMEAYDFPEHKPFFIGIINDDKNNIYLLKDDSEDYVDFDMFNRQGYFLNKIRIPLRISRPYHLRSKLKDGNFYTLKSNPETGNLRIIRYKIKNWDQLREFSPPS